MNIEARVVAKSENKKPKPKPFFIGVTGGTASGKTCVCKTVIEQIKQDEQIPDSKHAKILVADLFYRDLGESDIALAHQGNFNFDHPSAFDLDMLYETLKTLAKGEDAMVPVYSYIEHRVTGYTEFKCADVIIVEGIMAMYDKKIRDMFEMKIFVDTDADTRLCRRVQRDISDRGRTIETVIHQYIKFVKPSFDEFVLPTKKYVDIILPTGKDNIVAINLIAQHVRDLMHTKSRLCIDDRMVRLKNADNKDFNFERGDDRKKSKDKKLITNNIKETEKNNALTR